MASVWLRSRVNALNAEGNRLTVACNAMSGCTAIPSAGTYGASAPIFSEALFDAYGHVLASADSSWAVIAEWREH